MKITLSGSSKEIEFVKSVCRKKIQRGSLVLHVESDGKTTDEDIDEDNKEYAEMDTKEPIEADSKFNVPKDNKNLPKHKKGGRR